MFRCLKLFGIIWVFFFVNFNQSFGAQKSNKRVKAPIAKEKKVSLGELTLSTTKMRIKTSHGVIAFSFYDQAAPKTSARIQELAESGFYNGLIFHRVVPGFVIQGGDPTGTGGGGSGKKLPAEFSKVLKHELGAVAMARTQDPNSADSQFYIALGPFPHLDGQYTIFGKVVEGMDILDKIQQGDKMEVVTIEKNDKK